MARNVIGHQCYTFALEAYTSVLFLLFFFRKWSIILQSHTGTGMDGSERKKRAAEFWTHACSGPIVQGSLSVYPWLCLPP